MSYQFHAPTDDPKVLKLRKKWRRLEKEMDAIEEKLERIFPTPLCRLCKVNECHGSFDYTVCGPCWNMHNGKPPPP